MLARKGPANMVSGSVAAFTRMRLAMASALAGSVQHFANCVPRPQVQAFTNRIIYIAGGVSYLSRSRNIIAASPLVLIVVLFAAWFFSLARLPVY